MLSVEDFAAAIKNAVASSPPKLCGDIIKPSITQVQSINISCTPPAEWAAEVYNGTVCRTIRNSGTATAEQICNACYACCALDNTQNMVVTYRAGCIAESDYGAQLMAAINAALVNLDSQIAIKISKIIGDDISSRLAEADRAITAIQRINVAGIGVMQRVRQDIIMNIISQKIISDDILIRIAAAIDDYYKAIQAANAAAIVPVPILASVPIINNGESGTGASNTVIDSSPPPIMPVAANDPNIPTVVTANDIHFTDIPTTTAAPIAAGGSSFAFDKITIIIFLILLIVLIAFLIKKIIGRANTSGNISAAIAITS
jgi:hypothetical protein